MKKQNLKFRILNWLSQMVYDIRENHLLGLNNWLDHQASKHYKE